MKVYSPSDIASVLDVKPATLRKYSTMLEEQGYKIERNSQGHRFYQDKDIITLRNVIAGSKSGMTLEQSVKAVVHLGVDSTTTNAIQSGEQANGSDIAELKEMILQQNELIKELTVRLDHQQEYIDERMNERDKLLLESMNEIQESKKQITATKEKGFFARLFNK